MPWEKKAPASPRAHLAPSLRPAASQTPVSARCSQGCSHLVNTGVRPLPSGFVLVLTAKFDKAFFSISTQCKGFLERQPRTPQRLPSRRRRLVFFCLPHALPAALCSLSVWPGLRSARSPPHPPRIASRILPFCKYPDPRLRPPLSRPTHGRHPFQSLCSGRRRE